MRESGSAIVLKRPKQWIGIDLVAGAVQETAVIAADIVAVRGDSSAAVENICTEAPAFRTLFPISNPPIVPNGPSIVERS